MLWLESLELIDDVDEALIELGTRDGEPNIVWMKRERSKPNLTYFREEGNNPVYTEYRMGCLPMGQLTKEEIYNEGLDDALYFKYYISGKQFTNYSTEDFTFVPHNDDRIKHNGILYEVVKFKTVQVGENSVIHIVYASESSIVAQSEEYREKKDPYFEYDSTQDRDSTNDTGVNNSMYEGVPVSLPLDVDFPFILWDTDNKFKYKTDTMLDTEEYIMPTGTYSIEKFLEEFKPEGIVIRQDKDNILLETVSKGPDASLDILPVDGNIYSLLGIKIGLYKGEEVLKT